jgi:hypothetical protein
MTQATDLGAEGGDGLVLELHQLHELVDVRREDLNGLLVDLDAVRLVVAFDLCDEI